MKSNFHSFDLAEKIDGTPHSVKTAFLRLMLAVAIIALPLKKAEAQSAPTLSYTSPQVYMPNTVITPLTPTSSGVAAPAYSATPVNINTGLSSPFGVAVDASGNLYISDLATKIVKEFPAGGGAPVIIGSGEFSNPKGITVDAAGNVYAAGDYNGMVTEIAKSDGSAAHLGTGFNEFSDVAVDAAGNIYVADFGNTNPVKKILKSNGSTVSIGTGFSNYVISVATDAAGNVYVADTHTGIKEILASNGNTIDLGSGFNNPQGVAVDAAGNVFVSDQGNGAVKEIPAGSNTPVTLVSGLTNPGQIAVDGAGDIYFVDTTTGTVQEIKPVGGYYINALPPGLSFNNSTGAISGTTTAANLPPTNYTVTAYNADGSATAVINITVGTPPAPTLSYQGPQTYTTGAAISPLTPSSTGVSLPGYSSAKITVGTGYNQNVSVATDAAGNVYVADKFNTAIKKIPVGGGGQVTIPTGYSKQGFYGIAIDHAGNFYLSDQANNAVFKMPAGGSALQQIGTGFNAPAGLAVDAAGNVYVADVNNNAIKEILASNGNTVPLVTGLGNGFSVALDAAGNVYVAATFNNAVKKIPAGGGSPVNIGSGFSTPEGVAVDAAGNVYVSDFDNRSVKLISAANGTTSTLASGFTANGGLAVDGAGNVFVADPGSGSVDKISPNGGYYINTSLPAGLSFNGATGVISGTPSAVSAAKNYTVTAYNVAGSAKATVNIGVVAPVTITSITRQNAALTNTFYAAYTVVFSGPVTGLKPSNFSVTTTGSITGANINYVTGSGNTYTVVAFTGTGDGNLTLNMANDLGVQPGISTTLPFAGDTYTIDKTPPQLTTLYMGSNGPDYTKAVVGNIMTVHFGANEAITNIVATIDGHAVTPVSDGNNIYHISYTMTATDPVGLIHYSISYTDLAGNAFGPLVDVNDNIEFSLSSAVSSINIQNPAGAITNAKTVTWRVTFAADVTGVGTANFSLTSDGMAAGTISGINKISASVYDVTANNVSGDGNLTLNLTDDSSISPQLTSALPFTGEAYTIDNTLPGISFGNPSVNNTTTGPVSYIMYYGDANFNAITLTQADFTLNKTGTANGTISLSNSGGVYTVTIADITGSGTLGLTLAAGVESDEAGNLSVQQISPNFNVVSADATLSNLTIGGGVTYIPVFDKSVTAYYASVPNATTSTTITPTVADSHATVTISGNTATSGQPYTVSQLGVGDNGFAIKVTAQDGTTSTEYDLYITRAPSSVATLSNLTVDNGVVLTPSPFNKNRLNYEADVPNTVTSVNITPVVTDPTATITVGGNTIPSGTAVPFSLNIGINTFTSLITAQDGVTTTTYTATITRAKTPQNITFNALPAKTYGDADFAPGATSTNATIPITYTSDNPAVATIVNGQIHITGAGSANITASQAGSDQFLAATDVKVALSVSTVALTVTADAQSKIYGEANPALTYKVTAGALVGSDAFTGTITRTAGENAGTYPITQGTLALSNSYTLTFTGAVFTINKASIAIAAVVAGKVYGEADPALTYKITAGALVGEDAFTGTLTRDAGENAGSYNIKQGTLALNANYTLNFTGAVFTISKAVVAVAADPQTKVYGEADPSLTYKITSGTLVSGDAFTGALTRQAGQNVGSYDITQGTLALSANYNLTFTPSTFSITSAAITVTADAASKTYGAADPALTYKITNGALVAGDAFSGALKRAAGEATGDYTIEQGTLALNTNYSLSYVPAKFTITPAILTITADDKSKVYGAADPALTISYSGFTNGDNSGKFTTKPNISTTAATGSDAGTYPITVDGAVIANYTIVYKQGTLTVTPSMLTVTADNKTRGYEQPNPDLTVTYKGFVNGDDISKLTKTPVASTTAVTNSPAGKYPITVGGGEAVNYSFTYVPGSLTITASKNALLADLSISSGSLSPGFSPGTRSYDVSVEATVDKVTLTPVTEDKAATISINGTAALSGSPSFAIPLNIGSNTIDIDVTAQDGVTKTHYSVTVNRAASVALIKPTNILTPNGDGVNDTWKIPDIELFPDNYVKVFDRGGRQVYYKKGYANDWGGTLGGNTLAEGTYYYVVYLGKGLDMIYGYLTLLHSR